jgi:hypothetical protein
MIDKQIIYVNQNFLQLLIDSLFIDSKKEKAPQTAESRFSEKNQKSYGTTEEKALMNCVSKSFDVLVDSVAGGGSF